MKRDFRKDHQILKITADIYKGDVFDIAYNSGRTLYSPAAGRDMPPEKGRKIDPQSPEGQAIAKAAAARFNEDLT